MGRIDSYPNDGSLTDDDKVIGSDSAGGTKNYLLSDLKTYFQNGMATDDGIASAIAAAIATVQPKQKVVAMSTEIADISNDENNPSLVEFYSVAENPSLGSLSFNDGPLELDPAGTIQNTSDANVILKIMTSTFLNINSNNSKITFNLELSEDGGVFNNVKSVESAKHATGLHQDSFFSYFNVPAGNYLRITLSSIHSDNELLEFSPFEFEVQ